MKDIQEVSRELEEQIQEVMDPKDPSRLRSYIASLQEGMDTMITLIEDDPTILALALYGQIKFNSPSLIKMIIKNDTIDSDTWYEVKQTISVMTKIHPMIKMIEEKGLEKTLALAVIANFGKSKNKNESEELEAQYE